MYSRYNMYRNYPNMYRNNQNNRLIGGGFVGPLLLGGLAGYAIGRPNYYPYNNNYYYPSNYYNSYPYNYPTYYNNFYY